MAKQPEQNRAALPALGAAPANLEEYNAERIRRQAERDAKRPRLLDCLDPTVAKYWEDRKEIFEWRVQVKLFRPAIGKQAAHLQTFDEKVVAQNDGDAWAMFCDKINEWPSRRDSQPKITKLGRRTLRHDEGLATVPTLHEEEIAN